MVDTHAHLNFPCYRKKEEIIKRAQKAGVEKIICVSTNLSDSKKAVKIAKKYPGEVYAAVGIHPGNATSCNSTTQLRQLEKLAEEKQVKAIGECGLDASLLAEQGEEGEEKQIKIFLAQVEIAQKTNLPLIIHCRKSFPQIKKILDGLGQNAGKPLRGVFHCYLAGKKAIGDIIRWGFYFGAAGIITYDEGTQNVFAHIPLERTILETDSPFLAPLPYRRKQNEPAFLPIVAKKLAQIKKTSTERVKKITTQNARQLFHL